MSGTVLVTGASRGIGRAIALRLARDGYDIVVHFHTRRDAADQVATQVCALGRAARCLQFDVAQRDAVAAALAADMEAHGAYYGVVCNAGITRDAAFPASCFDAGLSDSRVTTSAASSSRILNRRRLSSGHTESGSGYGSTAT